MNIIRRIIELYTRNVQRKCFYQNTEEIKAAGCGYVLTKEAREGTFEQWRAVNLHKTWHWHCWFTRGYWE
jgi:hypothetical protein